MSISIGFRPVNPNELTSIDGGSKFWEIITEAHGGDPVLNDSHINWLNGVECCGYKGARDLINAICEYGPIQVKANW